MVIVLYRHNFFYRNSITEHALCYSDIMSCKSSPFLTYANIICLNLLGHS